MAFERIDVGVTIGPEAIVARDVGDALGLDQLDGPDHQFCNTSD